MNLGEKLQFLTGVSMSDSESEKELAGVEESELTANPPEEEEDDSVLDFNLGDSSINSYLSEKGIDKKPKKKKKTVREKMLESTGKHLFDDFFSGLDEENPSSLGKYRTGNSDLDETTLRSRKLLEQAELISADEFDSFLDDDDLLSAEEDAELRGHLISMGRKYARETASTAETSEINKTYADSEKRLNALFEEVSRDKEGLQKDIERMRVPGRGGKLLSDMVEARNSMHNTQLSIIKELNSMKKNIFDLKAKEAARKESENQGSNDISANTLQSIFNSARSEMMNSIGGYTRVSGAEDDSDDSIYTEPEEDDESIQKKYFSNKTSTSDGDKFLEYEGRGVEYVLIVDEDEKPVRIFAEDKDGIMIPDYPIPKNLNELTFDIDHISNMATDTLHRNYKVRKE